MIKNYDSIDITKFIASIFVVALHASALYDINPLLNTIVFEGIARLAVPLFFVISAFFFFQKEVTWERTKHYCKRLVVLYLAWFIVSIPKTIFDRFICSPYPIGETIFRFARSFFVTSTFSGSWFIISCVFCALLFYKLEQLREPKRRIITILIAIIVYLWITFTSAYGKLIDVIGIRELYDIYELVLANPYNSFLVGVPYFALGRVFAKNENRGGTYSRPNCLLAFVSFMLLVVEVYLTNTNGLVKATDCYLLLLPCVFFLFPIVCNWNNSIQNARKYRIASTIIFFSQFLLLFMCEFVEWVMKITIPCMGKFVFTIVAALVLVWVVLKFQDRKGFGWLRYFY